MKERTLGRHHIGLILLLLAPFVYAMCFTHPQADDFARSNTAWYIFNLPKALMLMVRDWFTWSGRYTHHFLIIFLGKMAVYRFSYTLMCAALMAAYWAALHAIFQTVSAPGRTRESFLFAGLCVLAIYSSYRALFLSYYLITDILGLGLSNLMILLFLWSLLRVWFDEDSSAWKKRLVLVLGALSMGCYEHAALAVAIMAVACALIGLYTGHRHKTFFVRAALVICAFLLLAFLAPGNMARQDRRDVTGDSMLHNLGKSWDAWLHHGFAVFPSLYMACMGVIALCIRAREPVATPRKLTIPAMLAFGAILFCVATGSIVLLHAFTDLPMASERGSKLTESLRLISAFFAGATLLACAGPLRRLVPSMARGVLVAALILAAPCTANYQKVLRAAASGELSSWSASLELRKDFLKAHPGEDLEVARLLLGPYPLTSSDPVPMDPGDWPAPQAAEFYHVSSLHSFARDPLAALQAIPSGAEEASLAIPGLGRAAMLLSLPGGNNTTSASHWLSIRADAEPPDTFETLLMLENTPGHLLARVMGGVVESVPGQPLPDAWWLGYAGIIQRHGTAPWRVGDAWWLVPVAAPEWGAVAALFCRTQDGPWRRVPMAAH